MMHLNEKICVSVVGARGYAGLELARILLRHPKVELHSCFAGEQSFALSDLLPEAAAKKVPVHSIDALEANLPALDVVFLATPAAASLELAPKILAAGKTVIDLSGAFRLNTAETQQWYGLEKSESLAEAIYGLSPFAQPKLIAKGGTLIANPGCYATAVLMALVPLLKAGVIEENSLVIDAKSGTSGAGRKAAENQLFTEVEGECLPYRVGKHQHLPEISRWAENLGGIAIDPFFTTSLLPIRRGITAGLYAKLKLGKSALHVAAAFTKAYGDYPLVRFAPAEGIAANQTMHSALSLKKVVGTARVHLEFEVVGEKLYLFSLIDNLLKGAASQAVENMNSLYGFPVGLALGDMEGVL